MERRDNCKMDMSNNGSDINVGSIEEDIKILENLKSYLNLLVYEGKDKIIYNDLCWNEKTIDCINSIENILQDYTRQKQINEEHQKINGELREKVKELEKESKILEFQNKQIENYAEELKKYNKTVSDRIVEYKKNSIPKQVVKDKIEELMIQGNYKTFYNPNGRTHFLKEESDYKIEVLQELLEGEKNNENIKS